jgi:hypothetical protein
MGYLKLCFWLLAVIDSGESIFFKRKFKQLRENSKISKLLLGISIETRISRLVKKTGVKKISLDCPFKGSVQRKLRWVWNSANRCVWAWDCGAGHYFEFLFRCRLVLNIFPFPVSTAKLLGDFYNNRRSAAKSYPRFAYSFVFLMLRQYY